MTSTVATTGSARPSTAPWTSRAPGREVSAAPQETGSSVTSPLDQVTATVSGSSGAPPTQTSWAAGPWAETGSAGATSTVALTAWPVSPTAPCTSTVPPSRLDRAASRSAPGSAQATGSSVTEPSDQETGTVWGRAARASAAPAPLGTEAAMGSPSPADTASGALTSTVATTGSARPSTAPWTSRAPGREVSAAPQETGSSVTSPLDQVTATVSGSSGAPPTQTSWAAGPWAETGSAGATSTVALTAWPVSPTAPCTSTVPPSRLDRAASRSAPGSAQATGSSVTEPSDQETGTVWGRAARASAAPAPLGTEAAMGSPSPADTASGALTSTVATTGSARPSTAPWTSRAPGREVSAAPQETGSSVTSPLDQVTATVSGSSGAPPTQTS